MEEKREKKELIPGKSGEVKSPEADKEIRRELYGVFENADTILLKKYVDRLDGLPIVRANNEIADMEVGSNVCLYHVDKIVYDREENIHDKLTTVYMSMLSDKESALTLIVKGSEKQVDLYMGAVSKKTTGKGNSPAGKSKTPGRMLDNLGNALKNVMEGNFPGTELSRVDIDPAGDDKKCVKTVIEDCFSQTQVIASVSGIAALRNARESGSSVFVQGMEKLIDSLRGQEYAVIYIADVMSRNIVAELCSNYEDIYSQLSPFRQSAYTLSKNDSETNTASLAAGTALTANESLAKTVTHGTTVGMTRTEGGGAGGGIKLGILEMSGNYNHSRAEQNGKNQSEARAETEGKALSLTVQNSVANAITSGQGESLQLTWENRAVKTLLERVDEQLLRLRACEDFGLFDSCVYFLSQRYETAVAAAGAYDALNRGENSSAESSSVNVWFRGRQNTEESNAPGNNRAADDIDLLSEYLKRFYHPMFELPVRGKGNEGTNDLPVRERENEGISYLPVTPALMISGRELAFQFSLPKKSVSGLPVLECAEFGRDVFSLDGVYRGDLRIGKIYHMHRTEETEVKLSSRDLTAHTFVTGSTGAGKSNAVYQLLTELVKKNYPDRSRESGADGTDPVLKEPEVTFLVIEPKKGEYKDIFGCDDEIKADVYGTNPFLTPLLRINPFRFPATTHIYEHMDRLVEIFNVCWPMYAAMPAVLKAALEKAYLSAGWDLERSENITGAAVYPDFATVAGEVKKYLESSEYSEENKGNYKGALLTRLESLTNGINGMIFTADDLSDEELFDRNVIVDLSQVGSSETKALIMGILVMKLQEYRMGICGRNGRLKHVTVLEEAHSLLRRTAVEPGAEGAGLLSKSVEMLSDAIAEMRTYGEAFIIADNSPGLLDMSVIRNTNTKMIFRLPDYSDRELVGRAANLNDKQIEELAKLKKGVATVYQNDWLSPVLCRFEKYPDKGGKYVNPEGRRAGNHAEAEVLDILMKADKRKKLAESFSYREKVIREVEVSRLSADLKVRILRYLLSQDKRTEEKQLAEIACHLFDAEKIFQGASEVKDDMEAWKSQVFESLTPSLGGYGKREKEDLLELLAHGYWQA